MSHEDSCMHREVGKKYRPLIWSHLLCEGEKTELLELSSRELFSIVLIEQMNSKTLEVPISPRSDFPREGKRGNVSAHGNRE